MSEWSSKEAKKAGQQFRREARSVFSEYQENLNKKLAEMTLAVKPRPKWMPRFAWIWLFDLVVDQTKVNAGAQVESPSDFLVRKHTEAIQR